MQEPSRAIDPLADRALRGLLHGINTGVCYKRDLTEQQWKILDPYFFLSSTFVHALAAPAVMSTWHRNPGLVSYQDFPDSALPQQLRDGNPLGIWGMLDGEFTRGAVGAR